MIKQDAKHESKAVWGIGSVVIGVYRKAGSGRLADRREFVLDILRREKVLKVRREGLDRYCTYLLLPREEVRID